MAERRGSRTLSSEYNPEGLLRSDPSCRVKNVGDHGALQSFPLSWSVRRCVSAAPRPSTPLPPCPVNSPMMVAPQPLWPPFCSSNPTCWWNYPASSQQMVPTQHREAGKYYSVHPTLLTATFVPLSTSCCLLYRRPGTVTALPLPAHTTRFSAPAPAYPHHLLFRSCPSCPHHQPVYSCPSLPTLPAFLLLPLPAHTAPFCSSPHVLLQAICRQSLYSAWGGEVVGGMSHALPFRDR